jgi:hypothetical protein
MASWRERAAHRLPVLFPTRRAPLQVGKEERDRAAGRDAVFICGGQGGQRRRRRRRRGAAREGDEGRLRVGVKAKLGGEAHGELL